MSIDHPRLHGAAQDSGLAAAEVSGQVRDWLERSRRRPVNRSARLLARLLGDPAGLPFLTALVDGVVRPQDPRAAATALRRVATGELGFLPWHQRGLLRLGAATARVLRARWRRRCEPRCERWWGT